MNILSEIAQRTQTRIDEQKKIIAFENIRRDAEQLNPATGFPFEQALAQPGISFICEIKRASPAKGLIAPLFPYRQIAEEYEAAGASAISVLTEPFYFQGNNQYLAEIAQTVSLPLLRKDFTVDPYMIYEARLLGASAILLICSLLEQAQLVEYIEIAHSLGLSALVEAHDEREVHMAMQANARVIGVNNRNLKDFTVDIGTSIALRKLIPPEILFVSESGIRTPEHIETLRQNQVNAVLVGETLMRNPDKRLALRTLRGDSVG